MSTTSSTTPPKLKRDREFWFVALLFWILIAPIFFFGMGAASTMPAELMIAFLDPSERGANLTYLVFLVLGLFVGGLMVRDIWSRLKDHLANRAA